jgi:hypothetical protein
MRCWLKKRDHYPNSSWGRHATRLSTLECSWEGPPISASDSRHARFATGSNPRRVHASAKRKSGLTHSSATRQFYPQMEICEEAHSTQTKGKERERVSGQARIRVSSLSKDRNMLHSNTVLSHAPKAKETTTAMQCICHY